MVQARNQERINSSSAFRHKASWMTIFIYKMYRLSSYLKVTLGIPSAQGRRQMQTIFKKHCSVVKN